MLLTVTATAGLLLGGDQESTSLVLEVGAEGITLFITATNDGMYTEGGIDERYVTLRAAGYPDVVITLFVEEAPAPISLTLAQQAVAEVWEEDVALTLTVESPLMDGFELSATSNNTEIATAEAVGDGSTQELQIRTLSVGITTVTVTATGEQHITTSAEVIVEVLPAAIQADSAEVTVIEGGQAAIGIRVAKLRDGASDAAVQVDVGEGLNPIASQNVGAEDYTSFTIVPSEDDNVRTPERMSNLQISAGEDYTVLNIPVTIQDDDDSAAPQVLRFRIKVFLEGAQ